METGRHYIGPNLRTGAGYNGTQEQNSSVLRRILACLLGHLLCQHLDLAPDSETTLPHARVMCRGLHFINWPALQSFRWKRRAAVQGYGNRTYFEGKRRNTACPSTPSWLHPEAVGVFEIRWLYGRSCQQVVHCSDFAGVSAHGFLRVGSQEGDPWVIMPAFARLTLESVLCVVFKQLKMKCHVLVKYLAKLSW